MAWATQYIIKLQAGETVSFRPRGNSMTPKIKSGQLCTVEPATTLEVGDVVLCKVRGLQYLHYLTKIEQSRYWIGNAHGRSNGSTNRQSIYGKLIRVEP